MLLENDDDEESISFIDDFKQNLFSDEIYVFTPKGDMVSLPKEATVLDFAYSIHSDLGNSAIGANVNRRVVTIDHKLRSGDQVEVITSKIMEPQEDWIKIVVSARAKSKIKTALKNKRKAFKKEGEQKLKALFSQLKTEYNGQNVQKVMRESQVNSYINFYYLIATGEIGIEEVKKILVSDGDRTKWLRSLRIPFIGKQTKTVQSKAESTSDSSQATSTGNQKKYIVSECCHPVPGDHVLILELPGGRTEVHRTDCEKAIQLMSVYGRNILKIKWKPAEGETYYAGLHITAKDKPGLLNIVTQLISNEFHLNMSAINMHSHEGLVFIKIEILVPNVATLKKLMSDLSKIDQAIKVVRIF